jgi:hypothetical protein
MFDMKGLLAVTALVAVGEGALPPAADVYAAGYKAAHYYVGQCACTPCHTTHLQHHTLLLHASCANLATMYHPCRWRLCTTCMCGTPTLSLGECSRTVGTTMCSSSLKQMYPSPSDLVFASPSVMLLHAPCMHALAHPPDGRPCDHPSVSHGRRTCTCACAAYALLTHSPA